MKSKIKVLLFLVLVVCLSLTSTAYAANRTEATTRVTYTKEGENSNSIPPLPSGASYEINIPADVSLNKGRELWITANSMSLSEGQSVVVNLDYYRTFDDRGHLHLRDSNTGSEALVAINRHDFDINAGGLLYDTDTTVAVFTGNSLQANKYGLLYLNLLQPGTIAPGTYEGTIYFTIELIYG